MSNQARSSGFQPVIVGGNANIAERTLSPIVRERRIAKLGLSLVADNGPAMASYDAPPVVAKVHDPVQTEAVRLAEHIRSEHKRVSATCNGGSPEFDADFSSQEVLNRALAILNKEGLRLGSMRVGDNGWRLWFVEERSVWDMLPSDCNPAEETYAGA